MYIYFELLGISTNKHIYLHKDMYLPTNQPTSYPNHLQLVMCLLYMFNNWLQGEMDDL